MKQLKVTLLMLVLIPCLTLELILGFISKIFDITYDTIENLNDKLLKLVVENEKEEKSN